MQSPSRVASAARLAGLLGVGLFALGPLTIQLGLASPFLGFRIFGLGLLAGLAALGLRLVGVAAGGAPRGPGGRAPASAYPRSTTSRPTPRIRRPSPTPAAAIPVPSSPLPSARRTRTSRR